VAVIRPDADDLLTFIFRVSSMHEHKWVFAISAAVDESCSKRHGTNKDVGFVEPRCRTPKRDTVAGLASASLWVSKMNLVKRASIIVKCRQNVKFKNSFNLKYIIREFGRFRHYTVKNKMSQKAHSKF
jgi:hypothetical protein